MARKKASKKTRATLWPSKMTRELRADTVKAMLTSDSAIGLLAALAINQQLPGRKFSDSQLDQWCKPERRDLLTVCMQLMVCERRLSESSDCRFSLASIDPMLLFILDRAGDMSSVPGVREAIVGHGKQGALSAFTGMLRVFERVLDKLSSKGLWSQGYAVTKRTEEPVSTDKIEDKSYRIIREDLRKVSKPEKAAQTTREATVAVFCLLQNLFLLLPFVVDTFGVSSEKRKAVKSGKSPGKAKR